MVKELRREIKIPEGIEVVYENREARAKKGGVSVSKKLPYSKNIKIEIKNGTIEIVGKINTKNERAIAGSIWAHFNNLIKGANEEYIYKLEICNVHFPMNVKLEGSKVIIKNFLGEKRDRNSKIIEGVKCSIKGNIIELSSPNKEDVGQTAANLERATKVSNRDRRVFQDGIYIIEKEGREL